MRRSQSPASNYCIASGRDSSDWDVWAFRAKLRLRSGMRCSGLEVSTAQRESVLLVTAICTRANRTNSLITAAMRRSCGSAMPALSKAPAMRGSRCGARAVTDRADDNRGDVLRVLAIDVGVRQGVGQEESVGHLSLSDASDTSILSRPWRPQRVRRYGGGHCRPEPPVVMPAGVVGEFGLGRRMWQGKRPVLQSV